MSNINDYPYDLDVDVLFNPEKPESSLRYYAPFSLPNNVEK
ncbi:MAG: hypothetical protein P8P74_16095 [Crocinitomicaceae bacterium]|nr:hypothetical protein [Crocinitomicaceae bacterium]